MTFREKLGNWISGRKLELWRDATRRVTKTLLDSEAEVADLRTALYKIRGLDTPKASHSLKRAVRIANEALGK